MNRRFHARKTLVSDLGIMDVPGPVDQCITSLNAMFQVRSPLVILQYFQIFILDLNIFKYQQVHYDCCHYYYYYSQNQAYSSANFSKYNSAFYLYAASIVVLKI